MAVIRRDIAASTTDVYARQWLFTLVEGMAQEHDAGRLVYVAQATGKRMTRDSRGLFVGLDGSAVTEADLAGGFLTPTVKVTRLEATIAFEGHDVNAQLADLKAGVNAGLFNRLRTALVDMTAVAMEQKIDNIGDGTIMPGEQSPLEEM
ncbi:hypothetical protein LCGC14_1256750 [marine sediment metagenome]|uniref:Uncharacterized protein n=1 Tax=marine sediment metagenome TaxID=412755 RepID=A0A0F9L4N2_9ZZZZ